MKIISKITRELKTLDEGTEHITILCSKWRAVCFKIIC